MSLRVAAVQLDAHGLDDAEPALERSLGAIAEAGIAGARLIVLPECTWPAYVLGTGPRAGELIAQQQERVLARYAEAAARSGAVVVVGMALAEDGDIVNVACVFEADGTLRAKVAKRFLWDADTCWFRAGERSNVIDTSVARLGVFVCADGRMPEIARVLALDGAELLVDPTALVTTAPDPRAWTNPQAEHMLATRARENGLHTIVANKVGTERDLVAYCGRSAIIGPDGAFVSRAAPDVAETLVADVEPGPARLPVVRRPELYSPLIDEGTRERLQVRLDEPLVPRHATVRITVASLQRELASDDLHLARDLGMALVVTHVPVPPPLADAPGVPLVARDGDRAVLIDAGGTTLATWLRSHGPGAPGDGLGPVVDTAAGRLGVLLDEDGLAPEPARCLMLAGAEVLVWFAGDLGVAGMAASRAAENRVALVVATAYGAPTTARILDPNGVSLADTGALPRLNAAVVSIAETRRKEMAPGTDVVAGRQPSTYGILTRS